MVWGFDMIQIGVTGWGDHDSLYPAGTRSNEKLEVYSGHFPIVEVDSSFYAVQHSSTFEKWVAQTPKSFGFIVKAYQGMTGHLKEEIPFESKEEMFEKFKLSISPLIKAGKLKAVLFQYPPWFRCEKASVNLLNYTKKMMGSIPIAIEFRNKTWFEGEMRERTISYLKENGWIHTVCDEPQLQSGEGYVPIVPKATSKELTIIRFHGRNSGGWTRGNRSNAEWRKVRCLYRYNEKELVEWKNRLEEMKKETKEICLLFNNNSAGDAADNAKQMIDLLNLEYEGLAPKQLDFFDL